MKCYDFEFDHIRLSDKNFVLCSFDSSGVETYSMGSEIEFNTVSTQNGMKYELTSSQYGDCLTATLQICPNPCDSTHTEVSLEDQRDVMRWLNRKGFHKFKLIDKDGEWSNIFFEASFNVSKIEFEGKVVGFELEIFTNRPFALQEPVIVNIKNTEENGVESILSKSDEEGYIYPDMEITLDASGDLEIYSETEDRTMVIKNCTAGEVITIEYPMIMSSLASHKIQNDFNWIFFRIASTFKDRKNKFTISLPCSIKLKYTPIVKVGI